MCNEHDSFAWDVLHRRHPALIEQIREAFPFGPEQHEALDELAEEGQGRVLPLPDSDPAKVTWDQWAEPYIGKSWYDLSFLWAESYFYRKLLNAVGYFRPGPWFGVDPFAHLKSAELQNDSLDETLAALDDLDRLPASERTDALLLAALWGNRADLGFAVGRDQHDGLPEAVEHLVADHRAQLVEVLAGGAETVYVVADNAGRELLADLMLIDHLLAAAVNRVVLHVKPDPYYVSDATTTDVAACLQRLARGHGRAHLAADRLHQAARDRRLVIATHPFYCAPLPFHDMPDDLADQLANAKLTILKGDLNYRRLVGDLHWPPTTPFADTVAYFPGPVATLRTLKSDVIVGLKGSTVQQLNAGGTASWRTAGTHALVQVKL
ncbi:damage-control phosphatase ARMT1 family protein [Flindersiella endophytica]